MVSKTLQKTPSMHIYWSIIKWRTLYKTFTKQQTQKQLSRDRQGELFIPGWIVPALIRFMVDWTLVLLHFMELWLCKLTRVYSHLEVLWQFHCRLWKRGVQWMDKHLWHFLSALCSRKQFPLLSPSPPPMPHHPSPPPSPLLLWLKCLLFLHPYRMLCYLFIRNNQFWLQLPTYRNTSLYFTQMFCEST